MRAGSDDPNGKRSRGRALSRMTAACIVAVGVVLAATSSAGAQAPASRPNILVIFGDDIGQTNVSAYSFGVMGYKTTNIDRLAR